MAISDMHTVNLGFIIDKKAEIHPERIAITDTSSGESYTYGDLKERSDSCAHYLMEMGLKRGDTVSIVSITRIESFDLMLACAKLGCIFVPINFRLSAKEVSQILSDALSPVVFYDSIFKDRYQQIDHHVRKVIDIDTISFDTSISEKPHYSYGKAEEPFVLIYTSGSSGEPKGVIQTHLNAFFKSVDSIIDWGMTYEDVVLVTAPLFHVAGLNALTISGLHLGGRLVLQNRFEAEKTLQIIEDESVTCFAVVATHLRMMVNAPSFPDRELGSLRFFLVGGEPLDPALQKAFVDKGVDAINVFGLSETTDGAIYQRPGDDLMNGSIGKIATHVEVKLVSDNFEEVPEGEVGELVIGGPTVSPGYWKSPQKTEETFQEGWMKTGDLAYRDKEGFFYMVGRGDDMIKSGAEKISPAEIEQVIASMPEVADVVVIGIPDKKWGQVPKAIVARKRDMEIKEEDIIKTCKRELASYKKPKSVVIVDELPKTGAGKVDRALIKKEFA
ncbi:MAG: AMP-binding protein [Deltaproteobacteria bacterium]|nr:AMP-binding protein [Deltaproteobacteria bacterium]